MKNFKVVSKNMFVQIAVPVEIGQIKLDIVYQLCIYPSKIKGKLEFESDLMDYENVIYMGMEIDGYKGFRKLKEFHTELGIDLDKLITVAASEKLDPQELEKWVNDNFKDKFKD
jgi:hypothetical protein